MVGAMRALIAVALIAFAVCADRAAAQQVVGGALPGPTLAVADVDDEGAIDLTLDAPDADEPSGRATTDENDEPPLWPDQAIVVTAVARRRAVASAAR